MKKVIRRDFFQVLGVWGLAFLTGCGISSEKISYFIQNLQTRGILFGFEGLPPWDDGKTEKIMASVGSQLGMEHYVTYDNISACLQLARIAKENRRRMGVFGYSMGREHGELFLKRCYAEGIESDIAVFLDGVNPRYKVSPVRKVVQIFGDNRTNFYGFRGRPYREEDFCDAEKTECPQPIIVSNCEHLDLPERCAPIILIEFAKVFR